MCTDLLAYYAENLETLRELKPDGRELNPLVLLDRQGIRGETLTRLYKSVAADSPRVMVALLVNDALGPYISQLEYEDVLRMKYLRRGQAAVK